MDDRMTGAIGPLEQRDHDDSPAVSPARLASFWGVRLRTVYRDIAKGALPAYRLPNGRIRIKTADARRYGRPIE
jgi:predicted site-specific integrase-resolvase